MGLYIAFVVVSILFILTLLWLNYTLQSRFNIMTYTILILMDDELKNQQKNEILKWIKEREFKNEVDLQRRTRFIITQLAQTYAQQKRSLKLASNLLWRLKTQE